MTHAQTPNVDKSYAFMDQTNVKNVDGLNVTNASQSSAPNDRTIMSTTATNVNLVNPPPPDKKVFVGIAYIPNVTEKVTKLIKKHVPNLCAAPRPVNKVGNLYNDMKEKLCTGETRW